MIGENESKFGTECFGFRTFGTFRSLFQDTEVATFAISCDVGNYPEKGLLFQVFLPLCSVLEYSSLWDLGVQDVELVRLCEQCLDVGAN